MFDRRVRLLDRFTSPAGLDLRTFLFIDMAVFVRVEPGKAKGSFRVSAYLYDLRSKQRLSQVKGADVKNEESLGQKLIDGVLADGKRVTTVLPAGSIGNQQPITVLSEQWFAPDLEILVMTKHSDPRTGETIYSLSNITRGEPAAGLFDVPPDYTIQDSSYVRTPAAR